MPRFIFTLQAQKIFDKLEPLIQDRIEQKFGDLTKSYISPATIKPVPTLKGATHRMRIGSYRLILQQKNKCTFWVIDLGHRRDIYR